MRTRVATVVRTVAVGLLAVGCSTLSVNAQGGAGGGGPGGGRGGFGGGMFGGMGGDMMGAPVTTRDLDVYTKILGLSPQQVETAKALVDGVAADFQPVAKAMRDKREAIQQEFRDTQDFTVWQKLAPSLNELRQSRAKIESSFMTDMKGILTEEQLQQWPAAERAQRRTKTIGQGMMSGERVDLIRLVERAELTPDEMAALNEILSQYETDLDRELVKRNELRDKAMDQGTNFAALFTGGGDADKAEEMIKKMREASTHLRDVNRRYERQIEPLLPEEKRAQFVADFKRESFPMIYRPSFASRVLDTAEKLADLDENQKMGLKAARESLTRESTALNVRSEAAWEEIENEFSVQNMRDMRGMGGMFNNPKMQEIRDDRRALEEATIGKVQGLLTEAQRAALPERDAQGGGGGRRAGAQADQGGDNNMGGGRRARGAGGRGGDQNAPAPQPRNPGGPQ